LDGYKLTNGYQTIYEAKMILTNTTLAGTIWFDSRWPENPTYWASLKVSGTGNITGNVFGKGFQGFLTIGDTQSPGSLIDMSGTMNLGSYYSGGIGVSEGILNFTGTTNTRLRAETGAFLYGTGTAQNDIEIYGTLHPEDYHSPSTSQSMTTGGKLILNTASKLKIRFDDTGASTKVVVGGNVLFSGATLEKQAGNIASGKTYVIIQYSGTRTGTFTTNALGAGTSIIYDDANKRVLVTKA
jgi:hypothetical protein